MLIQITHSRISSSHTCSSEYSVPQIEQVALWLVSSVRYHSSKRWSQITSICTLSQFAMLFSESNTAEDDPSITYFPNGAFSLSRQVYEGLVIMDYLREHSCDKDLIERFFDSSSISSLRLLRQAKADGQQSTQSEDQKLEDYTKKHSCFCGYNKISFREWNRRKSVFKHNYPEDT